MTKIRIGGVPEHFNLPWHMALEDGAFKKAGINLQWTDFHGGTGAMTKSLGKDELDIAVVLTEGMVSAIIKGNPSLIIQKYIRSPLIWGIHTHSSQPANNIDQFREKTYAISRNCSGSHLMAYVDAANRKWKINEKHFLKVGTLDGARSALAENKAQLFLWEKFTTKPLVDSGEFKLLSECVSPWPCFVIAGTKKVLKNKTEAIKKMLLIINSYCARLMTWLEAPAYIAKKYKLREEDALTWYYQTVWSTDNFFYERVLDNIQQNLLRVGVIDELVESRNLCSKLTRFGSLRD